MIKFVSWYLREEIKIKPPISSRSSGKQFNNSFNFFPSRHKIVDNIHCKPDCVTQRIQPQLFCQHWVTFPISHTKAGKLFPGCRPLTSMSVLRDVPRLADIRPMRGWDHNNRYPYKNESAMNCTMYKEPDSKRSCSRKVELLLLTTRILPGRHDEWSLYLLQGWVNFYSFLAV